MRHRLTGTVTFRDRHRAGQRVERGQRPAGDDLVESVWTPCLRTATYGGKTLTQSFLDSGSNEYFFIDTSLTPCTDKDLLVFYCPVTPTLLSPMLTATNGAMASGAFTLYSPLTVSGTSTAAPGLGINPTLVTPPLPFANSFDFGMPFFFGRTVYTSIEGRTAGSVQGPYFAF